MAANRRFDFVALRVENEASHRRAIVLDWSRVKALLLARKATAEDHVWLLRQDPSYFSDSVTKCSEHHQAFLNDLKGRFYPLSRHQRTHVVWGRVFVQVVTTAYSSLEIWSELAAQADRLNQLEHEYRGEIKQTAILPAEYLSAILKFEHSLEQSVEGSLDTLKCSVGLSSTFRPCFEGNSQHNVQTPATRTSSKTVTRAEQPIEQLRKSLQSLWEDDQELFPPGLTDVVDELQRLIQAKPEPSDSVSAHVVEILDGLSIACGCLREVQIYYSGATDVEAVLMDRNNSIQTQFIPQIALWASLTASLKSLKRFSRLGDPEDDKLHLLVDESNSNDRTEQLGVTGKSLNLFWTEVDRVTAKVKGFPDLAAGRLLRQARMLRRIPKWMNSVKEVSQAQYFSNGTNASLPPICPHVSISDLDGPKGKKKTRGTPGKAKEPISVSADQIVDDKQPIFALDNRALKVFRTVFYTPSSTATLGELPWTDFVHAMISTGFSAEKLYGSVWQFRPTNLDIDRSIQFHEPHPASKLPYRTARRFGRRLNRAYGWNGEMFVEKT